MGKTQIIYLNLDLYFRQLKVHKRQICQYTLFIFGRNGDWDQIFHHVRENSFASYKIQIKHSFENIFWLTYIFIIIEFQLRGVYG